MLIQATLTELTEHIQGKQLDPKNIHRQALQREAGPCLGICYGHHRQHV